MLAGFIGCYVQIVAVISFIVFLVLASTRGSEAAFQGASQICLAGGCIIPVFIAVAFFLFAFLFDGKNALPDDRLR